MQIEAYLSASRMRRLSRSLLLIAFTLSTLATSMKVAALETDARGYLGYVGVAVDEDIVCGTRACQGILASALFYGLSLSVQGDELGAQVVAAQDSEEDPELTIAQLTARTGFGGVEIGARLGKIIIPLGLYGSQRITPTARPGLVLPQSYFLNTYYDFLTLSDQGLAMQLTSEAWNFKLAAYKPRKEVIEQVIQLPNNEQANIFQGILSVLLGDSFTTSSNNNTVRIVELRNYEGGYVGLSHQSETTRSDAGFVRLDLNGSRLDALNLGNAWMLGAWEPSVEIFQLKFDDTGSKLNGGSFNLTYSAESWQSFGNVVQIDIEGEKSREYTVGGAYYWNDNWSGLLALHRLEGEFSNASTSDEDQLHSVSFSLAYSWN